MNLKFMMDLGGADLGFFLTLSASKTQAEVARELGVTPTAVGKRLDVLERRVGIRLVYRRARGFELSDEGRLLLEYARRIKNELDEFADAVSARRGAAAGMLRVAVSSGFGRRYVAPAAAHFKREHPLVNIRLVLTDERWTDLPSTFDVVIHIGTLIDSSWICRKLADNRRILCAAPSYLQRFGSPRRPEDLVEQRCLVVQEYAEDALTWTLRDRAGDQVAVRLRPWLSSNDGDVLRQWALDGHGIIQRSEWDVADHLAAGRLEEVLPNHRAADAPVVALTPARGLVPARVGLFIDALQRQIGTPPSWRAIASERTRRGTAA